MVERGVRCPSRRKSKYDWNRTHLPNRLRSGVVDDHLERFRRKIGILEFDHGSKAGQCRTQGETRETRFSKRRIDHSSFSKWSIQFPMVFPIDLVVTLQESIGDLEGAV